MKDVQELQELLRQIDRKSYPAYKSVKGSYYLGDFVLNIEHVQSDPFASPSEVSMKVSGEKGAFPRELFDTKEKKTALEDGLLRQMGNLVSATRKVAKGSGKSGLIFLSQPGQEIIERTACQIDRISGDILLRLAVGFPADGRTINSRELEKLLLSVLPDCFRKVFFYRKLTQEQKQQLENGRQLAEDQTWIRRELSARGLVAFVANGSLLPRQSGASDLPMKEGIAFRSPQSMEVTLQLPYKGQVTGMGIPQGVTLIVGGGYHGKSTLLSALERGVYSHIQGDGREYVITQETAVKSRAEDGRAIHQVDISPFIQRLPNGKDTTDFSTEDASGSTSQAAGVVEALEAGAKVLLIDEDTSATNFMIRDELMQRVVHRNQEPIIPFIARVRELYQEKGVSTILVAGSSGSYFYVADRTIQMDSYEPVEITELAREEAGRQNSGKLPWERFPPMDQKARCRIPLKARGFQEPRQKIKAQGTDTLLINREAIDLRLVEQLVDQEQVRALGSLLGYLQKNLVDEKRTLEELVDSVEALIEEKGLSLFGGNGLARPRRQEIFACLNRYRSQTFKMIGKDK